MRQRPERTPSVRSGRLAYSPRETLVATAVLLVAVATVLVAAAYPAVAAAAVAVVAAWPVGRRLRRRRREGRTRRLCVPTTEVCVET